MKKILTIVGPTAVGKTSLVVSVANQLNGEIIGLDSRQIYKGMEIGTAQPTAEEMGGIPHHLIGFREPSEPVSAGEYAKLVKGKIEEIQSNGKQPIICGGAGLYYRALTHGIFEGSVSDLSIRKRLNEEYDSNPDKLLDVLNSIDPEYGSIVHINNKKRLVRALEIYETTGRSPSEHFQMQKDGSGDTLDLFSVLLCMEKERLNERIEMRTEAMLAEGWVDEVKQLIKYQTESGLEFPPLNSIGYKQIQSYLKKEISYDEMKEEIMIKTRQFSRRQVQWFKKEDMDLKIDVSGMTTFQIEDSILSVLHKSKSNST
jgi:tRNA dimethylallyltransferase